jgi:two-component system, LytTR family, response regulator
MMRSLIVDDEQPARRQLMRLLREHADVEVIGEAANGLEALQHLVDARPDVMFLDIEMPGLSGFEVLAQLSTPPLTVFTTAFDEYAVRAFDANAVDYLMKPIQAARLAQTLERMRERMSRPDPRIQDALQNALTSLGVGAPAKVAARRGSRIILLAPKEIVYAGVADQLVFLHTATERFSTDRTIAELEQLLTPAGFFRISRSAIVNLHYARELLPWASGTWKVKMTSGVELDVSRERARSLKTRLA